MVIQFNFMGFSSAHETKDQNYDQRQRQKSACYAHVSFMPFAYAWCEETDSHLTFSRSDQDVTSPYNINTLSGRREVRIDKFISQMVLVWHKPKFSKLIYK